MSGMTDYKRCRKCNLLKPRRSFITAAGNERPRCQVCRRADSRAAYERGKERYRHIRAEAVKRWIRANPEQWKAIQAKSRKKRRTKDRENRRMG